MIKKKERRDTPIAVKELTELKKRTGVRRRESGSGLVGLEEENRGQVLKYNK